MKIFQTTKPKLAAIVLLIVIAEAVIGAITAHFISRELYSSAAVVWIFLAWMAITISHPENKEELKDFHERFYKL